MSAAATKLLTEYEALPLADKHEFVRELVRRFPPWDSGELSDKTAAAAGDELAAMLGQQERDSKAR